MSNEVAIAKSVQRCCHLHPTFAPWTQSEQMTETLLDRLAHGSHVLMMEGKSFRFRQSLQKLDSSSSVFA